MPLDADGEEEVSNTKKRADELICIIIIFILEADGVTQVNLSKSNMTDGLTDPSNHVYKLEHVHAQLNVSQWLRRPRQWS